MNIYVFNRNLELQGVLENFSSFIWRRRYFSSGDFELHCLLNEDSLKLLQRENIIFKSKDDSEAGYIETRQISLNSDGKELIVVKGKFITNYFNRRIIWGNENLNSTSEIAMRTLVDKQCINTPVERVIINLKLDKLKGYKQTTNKSISYTNLLEAIEEISLTSNLGFRNNLDPINKKLNFEIYEGVDRTINQKAIAPCIFSRDFENVLEQNYMDSLNNYKNVTLVAGQGVSVDRSRTTVGYGTGLDRFEVFTDAKDIGLKKTISTPKKDDKGNYIKDENGNTMYEDIEVDMTFEEYQLLLKQRGNEKLTEYKEINTFDSVINTKGNNVYKIDYDLGDIVTISDRKWGLQVDTRITEIEEVYENSDVQINATFGNDIPTLIDKIKRMVK